MYFIEKSAETRENLYINLKNYFFETENNESITLFNKHNHIILEILAVKRGAMHLVTDNGDYVLKEGEVAVINPLCLHFGEVKSGLCEYVCLTVNMKHWCSFCGSETLKTAQFVLDEKYMFLERFEKGNPLFPLIISLEQDFESNEVTHKCRFNSTVFSLFSTLFETLLPITKKRYNSRKPDFMRNVAIYLEKHYKDQISTKDIAKEFYMTVPCFCYAFKHNFGTSFVKYLADFRITTAIDLATNNDYTLSELAEAVGYLDYNYFSRTFKNLLGISPTAYFGKEKNK